MKALYEQVKERLSITDNMYDIIRVIDPNNKNIIIINDNKIERIENTCYNFWKRGMACNNCISKRAYAQKDTFVKIEYSKDKVVLVTATPVFIDERVYVIEMLKDISQNGKIFDFNTNNDINVCTVINEINEKIIRDWIAEVDSELYQTKGKNRNPVISDDYIKMDDSKLSILNNEIEKLRDILNEMCTTSFGKTEDKQRLIISQYLDKLIVEYMRNI